MNKRALLFLLPCCLLACSKSDDFSPNDEQGMQLAKRVAIFESKDSRQKWVLDADEVDFGDLNNAILRNPVLTLKQDGKETAVVTGETGTFDYIKKLVGLEGDAVVRALTQDVTLRTDRFYYDVDKDLVWSDRKTVVTRGGAKVTAQKGIETDSKLARIEFKKQSTQLPQNPGELRLKTP